MKKLAGTILLLCACISSASAFHGSADSLRYDLPMHFTANAGQWDASIRYALVGGQATIWFCDEEIVITRPRIKQYPMVSEQPLSNDTDELEVIRLKFAGPMQSYRVEALDTLAGVAHFYRGSDSTAWRKNATTHRVLRYHDVLQGLDLECSIQPEWKQPDVAHRSRSSSHNLDIRFLARGKETHRSIPVTVTTNGTQRTSYLDCSELHSYLAVAGFDDLTTYNQVQVEGDYAYLWGVTRSPVFPTRNAYQSSLKGNWDMVYIKYSIRDRVVVYSTYLGSPNPDVGSGQIVSFASNALIMAQDGKLFSAWRTPLGFPITTVIPKTVATKSDPASASAVFVLDRNGMLEASAYFGGPGILEPLDIRIHNDRIYLFSIVSLDSLQQITDDALETKAVFRPEPSNDRCGYLAVLNMQIDSLIYGSYIDPSTSQGGWNEFLVQKMDVAADGTVFIARTKMTFEHSKNILVNPAFLPDSVNYQSAYIMAIAPDLHHYTYATWFGFPDRSFEFQNMIPLRDHELYFTGYSMIDPVIGSVAASPFIHRFDVPDGCRYGIVVGHLGSSGSLVNATEICSNAYTPYCRGFFESFCGSLVWAGTGVVTEQIDSVQFALINPFDSRALAMPPMWSSEDNILIELNKDDLQPLYCSYWNHRFSTQWGRSTQVTPRPNGWVYYSSTPGTLQVPDWYMLANPPDQGFYAADVRIPTPCWTILCDLQTIDTIRVERRRGYIKPHEFDIDYLVSNASATKEARILKSWITYPHGLDLVAGADTQSMAPTLIAPGQTATCHWRLRMTDPALLGDTARVRCRVMYVDPESGADYPAPEELCVKEILIVPYDEPDPALDCMIEGPGSLNWTGHGLTSTPGGNPGPIRYSVTITNRDVYPVEISSFHLRVGEHCRILGDSVRPGLTLAPGASRVLTVDLAVEALRFAREIHLEVEARDRFDLVIHACRKDIYVPGALDLNCTVSGTASIRWYPAGSIAIPSPATLTLRLENPLDTVRFGVRAWADLGRAPHLAVAPGDSLTRGPFGVTTTGVKNLDWRLTLDNPPVTDASDTVLFLYEHDGQMVQCMHVIAIKVIDESVLCKFTAPDSLAEAAILTRTPIDLQYRLSNIGTVPVGVDRYELVLSSGAGVTYSDPLVRTGNLIAPGADEVLDWILRPVIRRDARTVRCTVTAYASDTVLSVCTVEMYLSGIDGLRCALTVPDSVHFIRDSLTYTPDPVPVTFDLSNVLDTKETSIEAEIDLTNAPRFDLANGVTQQKTLALIDSHSTAGISWLLTPLKAQTAELQDILVRYRSSEQGAWKECRASIFIEAWPEITEVRCAAGGHDSLFTDQAYEDIVPRPFQVSYTATNTGTISLTGCQAVIVLPQEFLLAGSDSIQSFGDLAPNESATQWWTLTTADQLSSFGPYAINWIWRSEEQGRTTGCPDTVEIVPHASTGVEITPLHLFFEAEMGDPPPSVQTVRLWTSTGLAMPWTAQSDAWYMNVNPVTGDHAVQLSVQPNTTVLGKGMHASTLELGGVAPNLPKRIAVEYLITSLTATEPPSVPAALSLGPVYPHPVQLDGEARIVFKTPIGAKTSLVVYDLLGRKRAVLFANADDGQAVSILKPTELGLVPGIYLLQLSSDQQVTTRMVSVVK